MKSHAAEREYIKQYLLGTIEAANQEQLEERLLADADFQEELSIAENEIVHAYLTGQLTEQERKLFENHFLSTPERQRKLSFFANLIESIDNLPKPLSDAHLPRPRGRFLSAFLHRENPFLKLSFAAVVLLLVFGGIWMSVQNWGASSSGGVRSQLATYTVTLSSGRQRDIGAAQTTRVNIPGGVEMVNFRLPAATGDYRSHRAVLMTDGSVEKFRTDELEVETGGDAGMLRLGIPSSALTRGDYELKLYGLNPPQDEEEIAVYYFRVIQ
jgi:hypothetical protein